MNDIFYNMNNVFVIVYLDNILIYSNLLKKHPEHVCNILEQLQEYYLHTKLKKCSFHTMEVKYLGVIITPDGIHMDPAKVKAILNWLLLWNVKEVQSFLGLANLYFQFINNYSKITKPLNWLTWKDTPWDWNILHHFNSTLPIVLKCNAFDYAIARILSQLDSGGKDLHPVTFYTHLMIPAELNYEFYDKELLAIVKAFQ
ncbi:hypothetical protein E4T56_gene16008 [Termitomyces sp. T112]|nr:hypothetical protein E4T56_gene16008 [Termitomyces sp. T112]